MTRPTQARVAAGDLRLPASQARTSCGFCAATYGQPGTCQDAGHHCKGTWPDFVRKTTANPDGCSSSGVSKPVRPRACIAPA
jgi:hypothetical protein